MHFFRIMPLFRLRHFFLYQAPHSQALAPTWGAFLLILELLQKSLRQITVLGEKIDFVFLELDQTHTCLLLDFSMLRKIKSLKRLKWLALGLWYHTTFFKWNSRVCLSQRIYMYSIHYKTFNRRPSREPFTSWR